jgi:LmbE family N-acetylglucosaminyl deacetylase
MLTHSFNFHSSAPIQRVLCLGAHSDDIEIGCGGTLLKLMETCPDLVVHWVVLGAAGEREMEAIASATEMLTSLKQQTILVKGFRDSFFPYVGLELKEFFASLKQQVQPDLIFTHYRHDAHQDHRLVSELTWNTFRNHWILEYEIPKYDGDLGNPNVFVHLNQSHRQAKIAHLLKHFRTQENKHWFSEDTFSALLRLRGIESNAPERYAEAFYCRKLVFS